MCLEDREGREGELAQPTTPHRLLARGDPAIEDRSDLNLGPEGRSTSIACSCMRSSRSSLLVT
ncbi:hypothetical protein NKG05_04060 [Oerskovia sp. M15]